MPTALAWLGLERHVRMLLPFYLPWKQIHGLKEGSHALQCHVHGFLHQNVEYAEIASIDFMTPTLRWKKSETEVASNAIRNLAPFSVHLLKNWNLFIKA